MTNKDGETPRKNPMVKWLVLHSIVIAALVAGLFALTKMSKTSDVEALDTGTIVYLVRHAEKVTGENAGADPALTLAGQSRAMILENELKDSHITKVFSSDYKRTRDTAAPTAKMFGLEIEIYNPRDLAALAEKIKNTGGHILVVGHSNTIPETVNALGGVGGTPIDEANEYDRLYVVTIGKDGVVQTQLKHYGRRYEPSE